MTCAVYCLRGWRESVSTVTYRSVGGCRVAWKVEHWLAEVFPGKSNIYSEYRDLRPRELAIVVAAVLDSALAELLAIRLNTNENEMESFLGLKGDGRAPAASFGARIQLCLLLNVLSSRDAAILRTIKSIRNEFSHRVNVGFLSPEILKGTTKLLSLWKDLVEHLSAASGISVRREGLLLIEQQLRHETAAGEGLLLAVFSVYQAYFHLMHARLRPIGSAIDRIADDSI